MGDKVKIGIKNEDGSYTYLYDRSSSLGGKESKITTADKIDTGVPKPLPSKKKKKMPGKITGTIKTLIKKTQDFSDKTNQYFGIGGNKEDIKTRSSGSKKAEKKKMPKARDMAMGDKNIVYLGDPFMVDGEMFDPVKADPETYLRPKGAKTYSTGGDVTVGKGGDYIKDLID